MNWFKRQRKVICVISIWMSIFLGAFAIAFCLALAFGKAWLWVGALTAIIGWSILARTKLWREAGQVILQESLERQKSRVNGTRVIIAAFAIIAGYSVVFIVLMLLTFNWLGLERGACFSIALSIPTVASVIAVIQLRRRGWFYKG